MRPGSRIEQRQRDVLDRAGAGEQVEALEHEAEPLAADARKFRLARDWATSTPSK